VQGGGTGLGPGTGTGAGPGLGTTVLGEIGACFGVYIVR